MQLNELTGIKNIKVEKQNIREFLESLGFKYLNEGRFASTYKGKNSVLKVFEDDNGYEQYVKFIKNIPNKFKDFVPKITSVRSYPFDKNIKFIKIEFLNEVYGKNDDIVYYTNMYSNLLKYVKSFDEINSLEKIKTIIIDFNNEEYLNFFNNYGKFIDFGLLEFLIYLRKTTPNEFYLDLHSGNIMMRGKQFVVTDPWIY